jgi:REP element-mobilizing transposase RayT
MKQVNFETGKYYHLFNRGNNKQSIFFDEENYLYFLELVKKHLTPTVDILAYCLLKNHFHFVIQIKTNDLPDVYKSGKKKLHQPFSNLFNAYTKAINKKYERSGSLFQEHLKRKEINTEEYLRQVIIYVHLNPASHRLTSNFENFPHSSYNSILSLKPTLLNRSEVVSLFEDVDNFKFNHRYKKINHDLLAEIIIEDT